MAQPFLGQITIMAFSFPPRYWAACNGAALPISQYQALFSILGKTYGGDGITTFNLPDLRGRAVMHPGTNVLGTTNGVEQVTLVASQIPSHTHTVSAVAAAGTLTPPANNVWASSAGGDLQYGKAGSADVLMAPNALNGGPGLPHNNMPPMTVLNFVIALSGIFPSRN